MANSGPSDADFHDAWLSTRILVRYDGRTQDLDAGSSLPIGAPMLAPTLAILTACDPHGRPTSAPANRAANRALRAALEVRGLRWHPASGRARDGGHVEPGFAIPGLSARAAEDLGRAWGQLAVFWATDDEVLVLMCDGGTPLRRPRGPTRPMASHERRCLRQI